MRAKVKYYINSNSILAYFNSNNKENKFDFELEIKASRQMREDFIISGSFIFSVLRFNIVF